MKKVIVRTDAIPKNVWREILNYLDKNWSEIKIVRVYRDKEFNDYYLSKNIGFDDIYGDLLKKFVIPDESARRQVIDLISDALDEIDPVYCEEGSKIHINWYKEWINQMKFRSLYPSSVLIGKWLGKDWRKWIGE